MLFQIECRIQYETINFSLYYHNNIQDLQNIKINLASQQKRYDHYKVQ